MARFKGWLTGDSNQKSVTRTGTKNSGIRARLDSTTGLSVFTTLYEQSDGNEAVRIRIETRGKKHAIGTWIVDEDGALKKIR